MPVEAAIAADWVPQTWLEHVWSVWDRRLYTLVWQQFPVTIAVNAAATNQGNIQITDFMYVFKLKSRVRLSAGGFPTEAYRIGFQTTGGDAWTGARALSAIVTGDVSAAFMREPTPWYWPREMDRSDILTVDVQNLDAAAVTVDAAIEGYLIRARREPLKMLTA